MILDTPKGRVYYEFKSVKNLPPADFLDQFRKDLYRDNFSIDNLRWVFDGKKIKPANLQDLRKSLEGIEEVKQQVSKLKLREAEFIDVILNQVFIVK